MPEAVTHPESLASSADWSPAPILEAIERYAGTFVDLDGPEVFGPDKFARARDALTVSLRQQGLQPGARVIVALPNGPLFIATLTAILANEGCPLLLHAKTPVAELVRYARRFSAPFLACQANDAEALAGITRFSLRFPFGDSAALDWTSLKESDASFEGPLLRGVPLHPTSGSTGLPKVALRPGFQALEEARHYAETLAIDADDTILAIPPMSHAYGYGMCVMVPLLTGANVVSTRSFGAKSAGLARDAYSSTILPLAPAALESLSSLSRTMALSRVRWVLVAGAVLPRRTAQRFREKTGLTPCPLYGTTETGGISVATAADGRDVDGRVGPPMDGVEVEVRPASGTEDAHSDLGKLFVRSSSLMVGYLDDQGRITNPVSNGLFETGDLARTDDGTIYLRGRASEVVNVFGLKVVPCEVEEVIAELPGVLEVKIYAGEHPWGSQMVKAAVCAQGKVSESDIRAHCERELVDYKRPQVITLVDTLPRTSNGKVDRSQLP
jgi:acyl-CoA synthetase (AMP-forming)/AMP-acid ligase II